MSDPEVTESELMKLIREAARDGKSLTSLISGRDSSEPRPPVVIMGRMPRPKDTIRITTGCSYARVDVNQDDFTKELLLELEERDKIQLREALQGLLPK